MKKKLIFLSIAGIAIFLAATHFLEDSHIIFGRKRVVESDKWRPKLCLEAVKVKDPSDPCLSEIIKMCEYRCAAGGSDFGGVFKVDLNEESVTCLCVRDPRDESGA